ncbi:fatty acid desaturase [bacterium]|nr:MAG: fatty acid desaturase [bacterium]
MAAAQTVRPENWQAVVARYREGSAVKALLHTAAGVAILAASWTAMAWAYEMPWGPLWGLTLAVPAGAMLVRLFAIQHDCGHGALFNQSWANDLVGRLLAPFVMTPYTQWAREHAKHHATSGHLEFRGIGDVDTWTVREYREASRGRRLWYRVLRHPVFLFGPGALGYFLFVQRLVRFQRERRDAWVSVWSTNAVMAAYILGGCWWLGAARFFWLWLPSVAFASTLGTWIFYIGHQFPETYWATEAEWDVFAASMRGASFYRPGALIDFATCDIGYHHIHHLASRIPFYNLARCHRENPMFHVKPLWFVESLRCATLALWDEDKKRLVPFSEVV